MFGLKQSINYTQESIQNRIDLQSVAFNWIAPEIVAYNFNQIGPASDVFSLGLIIYHMLVFSLNLGSTEKVGRMYNRSKTGKRRMNKYNLFTLSVLKDTLQPV